MQLMAIGRATCRESLRDPAFLVLLLVCGGLIAATPFFTFFTFQPTAKTMMIKDMGLATITLAGLLFALFSAAASVSREIENQTALTVLAKPVTRRTFVAGKFVGIMLAVTLLFCCLTVALGVTLWLDHAVNGQGEFLASLRLAAPEVLFAYLEIGILTAVSVGLALFLPFAANLVLCFLVYGLANVSTSLLAGAEGQGGLVRFLVRGLYVLLPNFDNFSLDYYHGTLDVPPLPLVLLAAVYGILYTGFVLALAAVFFEERELA